MDIYLGDNKLVHKEREINGCFVKIDDELFYKISHYDLMDDFFMTIVSDSDHWMYLSSNGALTAGRKDRNSALFPYYTVDKIHESRAKTGSVSYFLVERNNKSLYWEPFSEWSEKFYTIERNIYKSIYGNKVIFEEINTDLELKFSYAWSNSEKFGWIREAELENLGKEDKKISLLDGIRNILPYGMDYYFQNEYSNLSDAYKKNELLSDSKIALFMLSSIPVDRAEPSEALKTTSVWSYGWNENANILISEQQIEAFKNGFSVDEEEDIRGRKGAYLINADIQLAKEENKSWFIVAEVNQSVTDVVELQDYCNGNEDLGKEIELEIEKGTQNLIEKVSGADGLQLCKHEMSYARHFSNTLYNIMRGGVYANAYNIEKVDFAKFIKQWNLPVFELFENAIEKLPSKLTYQELKTWAASIGEANLERLTLEYLPLTFSRRHGDPSRPWNQFAIELKNEDGSEKLHYEGNWRDIFQNWEALNHAFPEYIEATIAKFVNASTADGYNPYRITRDGIDWEAPDPDDPWAYIGYWGDHQIIYLQKFLEQLDQYYPEKLETLLDKEIFVYANVPYRIKELKEIIANPKDTIEFDHKLHQKIEENYLKIGADAKLLNNKNGELQQANLLEKVLLTLLTKMSNFVPDAGIWLNTQRPEWNDANNALVGNGASMVTLSYLRRFLKFWQGKIKEQKNGSFDLANEILELFEMIHFALEEHKDYLMKGFSPKKRYDLCVALGKAGSSYRSKIYTNSFSGEKSSLKKKEIEDFFKLSLAYLDKSIENNRREDALYHSYNLLNFGEESISIRHLYEMLEGQVAVLSSGKLEAEEALEVMNALKGSSMFREDQYSYLLYPNRDLPRFMDKNNIPDQRVKESALITKLISEKNETIIIKDKKGKVHFNGKFRNADVLKDALLNLDETQYGLLIEKESKFLLDIYEEIFDHQSFTGRSGTFFGYEGLGSIYWHMVSKLQLAILENYFNGINKEVDPMISDQLKAHYYEIKAGIGLHKSPEIYGAFPTDAYSHTPENAGAKQPGLTGQVKEDVISRYYELGLHVIEGEIRFSTSLMNKEEFLDETSLFIYRDLDGKKKEIKLEKHQMLCTFCQLPVIHKKGIEEKIEIHYSTNNIEVLKGNTVPANISAKIFARTGEIALLEYTLPE